MRRQIFPNNVNRIQTHPLIIEEYDTWIGLNLTDRSKLAFRTSNSTWTEGFNLHTYVDWNTFAKLDNAGGNENCGFVKYRHDCTVDNFIQISIQDSRCDIQLPFACRLKRDPPTPAPTAPPPTTTTSTTAEAFVKITASEIPSSTPTATIERTKKTRETCMV
uniref:C-type lectin domain-containing protein n=1 Tax=Panagrolaimus sp. ES5 TaxID=591445 RepID=A0AC34GBX4_9BILA